MVVEISPASPDAALTEALIASCSYALGDGRCVLETDIREPTETRAVVRIVWKDAATVHVEVGAAGELKERPITRELRFEIGDPPVERFRAVGFVIGALAGEVPLARDEPGASPAGEATKEPLPGRSRSEDRSAPERGAPRAFVGDEREAERPSTLPQTSARHQVWLDAGARAGPGLADGRWRYGAGLRASLLFDRWFLTSGLGYSAQARDERGLALGWVAGTLGVGFAPFGVEDAWHVQGRLEGLVQRLEASIDTGGASDHAARWVGGLVAGFDAGWFFARPLGAAVGASLSYEPATTEFVATRGAVPLGRTRNVNLELLAALRFDLD